MIAHLEGKLIAKEPLCIVSVDGIGYELLVPERDVAELRVGDPNVVFHTYLYVRENRLSLYGFLQKEDRELFSRLIEVTGIGPKIALGIVAAYPATQVIVAVKRGDTSFLRRLPGLGKRTAERLVMELGDKLEDVLESPPEAAPADVLREEVILALTSLGMARAAAERALEKINWGAMGETSVEAAVKEALKYAGSV